MVVMACVDWDPGEELELYSRVTGHCMLIFFPGVHGLSSLCVKGQGAALGFN